MPSPASSRDLLDFRVLDRKEILRAVKQWFESRLIYSAVGPVLIAVNPYQYFDIYSRGVAEGYRAYHEAQVAAAAAAGGKARSGESALPPPLAPHIFGIAASARARLSLANAKNQSIIISGESGAGKTEATKLVLKYLAYCEGEEESITDKILSTNPILEAFGNAKTVRNNNSSRFGKLFEVYYSRELSITGAKIQNYLLEKSRITSQSSEERNFHVFYYMSNGINDPEKRKKLQLLNPSQYSYLKQAAVSQRDDSKMMEQLQQSMTVIGLLPEIQWEIFATLSAILRLGNIQFAQDGDGSTITPATRTDLAAVAELLQIPTDRLEDSLITTAITVRGEQKKIKKLNLPDKAASKRDALAKALYAGLFDWLVTFMNDAMGPKDSNDKLVISVLDIFGFENFDTNSFEQLNINYANERLHAIFTNAIFDTQKEYLAEEIPWTMIQYPDNSDRINLFEGQTGILGLLAEETLFPKATDVTFTDKLVKHLGDCPRFRKPNFRLKGQAFTVEHFAADVEYMTEGFLEKNKDPVTEELLEMISCSKLGILPKIFAPHGTKVRGKPSPTTVSAQFRKQLQSLVSKLEATDMLFVRCIKPNNDKAPKQFDSALVDMQLTYNGVMECARVLQNGFAVKMSFESVKQEYPLLGSTYCRNIHDPKAYVQAILDNCKIPPDGYILGKTCLFLRENAYKRTLDQMHAVIWDKSVVLIQRAIRKYIFRKALKRKIKRKRLAAAEIHMWIVRRRFLKMRTAAIVLQKFVRGFLARKHIRRQRDVIVERANVDVFVRRRSRRQSVSSDTPIPTSIVERPGKGQGPVLQGWLFKEGGGFKSWKKRWFVLCNSSLSYFEDDSLKGFKGSVDLSVDVLKLRWDKSELKAKCRYDKRAIRALWARSLKRYGYQLQVESSQRIFRMAAATMEERNRWAEALTKSLRKWTVQPWVKEGSLLTRGDGKSISTRGWRRRYFYLSHGRLDFYEDENRMEYKGGIELINSELGLFVGSELQKLTVQYASDTDDSQGCIFFWLLSQNKKHLLGADTMAEVESWMLAIPRASHYLQHQNRTVIKSGWVLREGKSHKGLGSWEEVFITLRRGQIDFFEDEDGGEYRGTLKLESSTLFVIESGELDLGQQYSLQSIKGGQYRELLCIQANRQKAYIAVQSAADVQHWAKAIDLAIVMNGCLATRLPDDTTYYLQNADKMTLEQQKQARDTICAATKIAPPESCNISIIVNGELQSLKLSDRIGDIMRGHWDINVLDAIEQRKPSCRLILEATSDDPSPAAAAQALQRFASEEEDAPASRAAVTRSDESPESMDKEREAPKQSLLLPQPLLLSQEEAEKVIKAYFAKEPVAVGVQSAKSGCGLEVDDVLLRTKEQQGPFFSVDQFLKGLVTRQQVVMDVTVWRDGRVCQTSCIALPSGGFLGVELALISLSALSSTSEEPGALQESSQAESSEKADTNERFCFREALASKFKHKSSLERYPEEQSNSHELDCRSISSEPCEVRAPLVEPASSESKSSAVGRLSRTLSNDDSNRETSSQASNNSASSARSRKQSKQFLRAKALFSDIASQSGSEASKQTPNASVQQKEMRLKPQPSLGKQAEREESDGVHISVTPARKKGEQSPAGEVTLPLKLKRVVWVKKADGTREQKTEIVTDPDTIRELMLKKMRKESSRAK